MDPLKEETQYYERFKDMLGELEQLHLAEVGQLQVQVLELQKRLGESYFAPRCASPVKAIQPHADSRPQTEGLGPEVSHLEVPPSPVPEALQLDEPSVTSDADGEAAKPAVAKLKRDGSASAQSLVSSILESIDDEDVSGDLLPNDPKWLERTRHLFMGPRFEFSVCLLLVVNLILMAVQLQFHGMGVGHSIGYSRFDANPKELYPFAEDFFYYADLIFAIIFTLEMMIRWFVIRWDFWRHCLNWIDFLVVVSSWVELFAAALPISPTFLRMMRLGKLLRALRVVRLSQVLESLQLLLKCIVASLRILFWSLVLLMIIQCSAGMTISYMLSDYMSDPARADESARYEVFRYYGTFSKTILTMFEVLFANWAPACRVLIDNVSEAYSLAFIIYRCFVGFAVLNVVNAVFVQSTMKVALADDEIVANEKARAQAAYTRRVNALFSQADTSGDGVLDLEEFLRLLDNPQLQVWLHMIELDTTDLLGLFKMLDDGDGEISLEEFQEGMKKMKGMAKSLDLNKLQHEVAKLHVKVDCLFGSSAGPAIFKATKHLSSSFGSTASRARARLKKNQV